MNSILNTLAVSGLVVAGFAGPAAASQINEVTLYDAPQQSDSFFQASRGLDVFATGSVSSPAASAGGISAADEITLYGAPRQTGSFFNR